MKVRVLDEDMQQQYVEMYCYLIETAYKTFKQVIFIVVPPRFFHPCCRQVGHYDQNLDGVALNEFIRNANYLLSK